MPQRLCISVSAVLLLAIAPALGCSGSDSRDRLNVGHEPRATGAGGSAGAAANAGNAGTNVEHEAGTGANVGSGLSVRVDDRNGLTIEIVTLQCAGDCAEVTAVASGGNPPYAFAWSDGSNAAARELCADTSTDFEVSVTDTSIVDDEFHYDAHTASATVSAEVLDCSSADAGVPHSLCRGGATAAFQILMQSPSTDTGTYMQMNGSLDDYRVDDELSALIGITAASTIVRQATLLIDIGMCQKLLLAGDAAGTAPVGWDNELVVEYRNAPGAQVEKRWFYGSSQGLGGTNVIYVPSGEMLSNALEATVPGSDLTPPVANPLPFGYEPLAIDLMRELPAGVAQFELTFYVIDTGGVGSTTDIWAIPQ